eukprot:TRINITY_DN99007_c0_g1_i1.p1 TRINITY_DN99007_c0_g1~~TRINITY_DN99007_c0_g1_i1.p1  ORF type:complete len:509 (-),score=50.50 TRINITY_DN99007_c0_g1_i1:87-1592(-)
MDQLCVSVPVTVSGLNGDTLHVTTNLYVDVASVKQQVMDQWGIPPTFQRPSFDLGPLQSTPELVTCLVIGMDEFRKQMLFEPDRAVRDFIRLPCTYQVEDTCIDLIGDAFMMDRCLAADLQRILTNTAGAPLDRVIDTSLHLCSHAQAWIKLTALRALHAKVHAGTWSDARVDRAITAAAELCRDADAHVRCASVSFLSTATPPRRAYLDRMITAALELCHDNDVYVKRAAVCTLKERAFESSDAVMDALCTCALDLDTEVKVKAWEALRTFAGKDDRRVRDVAIACVKDAHPGVQLSALAFLDDNSGVEAAKACCLNTDATIRYAALRVLETMTRGVDGKGDEEKRARLDSDHDQAVSLLLDAAHLDDASVAVLACLLLQDPVLEVRNRALTLLSRIATPDDETVVRAICCGLDHDSSGVQESALRAMAIMTSKGNETVISAICKWLIPGKPSAMRALKLLCELAGPGNPNAVRALQKCLDDGRTAVRDLAHEILTKWEG